MYFTEKQLRIMQFIQQFRRERGISPTLEEIAEAFGVTKITIYEHINQLERKGALKREKFRARSIELLAQVEERNDRFSLPLVGSLPGSAPIESAEPEGDFSLSEFLPLGKKCFALRVEGNDLVDEHIASGDLLIVERRREPKPGDTVVVNDAGNADVRKYYGADADGGAAGPSPDGRGTGVLTKDPEVCGVVIGVVRRLNGA